MTTGVRAEAVGDVSEQRASEALDPIPVPIPKLVFDKLAAGLGLVVLAPLFAVIALAIKVDGWLHPENRGPVFYEEHRVSQGQVFSLYKFRVMKTAAIEAARQEQGYDHVKPLETSEQSKTQVGRWLQGRFLDELPQLFNILKGDMSLVGPRPWPVPMVEKEVVQGIYRKQLLRPGLTGLVQAHKDEVKELGGDRALDEAYIQTCQSLGPVGMLLFDLRLIAASFRILAKGERALR